ncbi:hypothetical protein [Haloplanus halobius]|uniref:hypothetical protein n=1 Tax=Haloplanus halobius TaxID=2934938 RepID=UPI00200CE0A2|nr:hypothetical protein [Haloplanus sp. XH21]
MRSPRPIPPSSTPIEGGFEALFGETDIYVTVQNDGAAGGVIVELVLLDSEETIPTTTARRWPSGPTSGGASRSRSTCRGDGA